MTPAPIRRAAVRALLGAGVSLAACASDDFGPTGGTLPLDVNQDSLAIELDPPLSPSQAESVTPDLTEAYDERQVLLLGSRRGDSWRASPLLRFDFSDPPEEVDLSVANWAKVEIIFQMFKADKDSVELLILRDVELFDLADTLVVADAERPLADVLGPSIRVYTRDDTDIFSPGSRFRLTLADPVSAADPIVQMVDGWVQSGTHRGIALVETAFDDTTPDLRVDHSLVRFAADGFSDSNFGFLETLQAEAIPVPILKITLNEPEDESVLFTPQLDLTHLEIPAAASSRLQLSSHQVRRPWLLFDLDGPVPSNATINQAELVLHLDEERSVSLGARTVTGFLATLDDAAQGDRGEATSILRASTLFVPGTDDALRLNVTEMVQRSVNGLVDADQGVLLTFGDEVFDVSLLQFFDVAAVDSLRPHLTITYTPPADFVE